MNLAFLGLGRMGAVMAGHAVTAGHTVTTWNRSPGKSVEGARSCATPGEAAAEAEVVVTMLFDGSSDDAVLFTDEDAVAGSAKPGTLIISATTIGPDAARALSGKALAAGLRFVDAPVAGSVPALEKGAVGVFLGGSEPDVAEAKTVVGLWGDKDRLVHVGEVGQGNALKIVVNACIGLAITGVGETMRLAHDLGLDRTVALNALAAGPFKITLDQKKEMIAAGDYSTPVFSLDALTKDVALAVGQAKHELDSMEAVLAYLQGAQAAGHGEDDYAVLAAYLSDEGRAGSQ